MPTWKRSGREYSHHVSMINAVSGWHERLKKVPGHEGTWTITICISVSIQILTDLYERTKNELKRERLDRCFPKLQAIHDFIDEKGVSWPSYELANEIAGELYKEIDF